MLIGIKKNIYLVRTFKTEAIYIKAIHENYSTSGKSTAFIRRRIHCDGIKIAFDFKWFII